MYTHTQRLIFLAQKRIKFEDFCYHGRNFMHFMLQSKYQKLYHDTLESKIKIIL